MFGASRKVEKLIAKVESFHTALLEGEDALSGEIVRSREEVVKIQGEVARLEESRNRVSQIRGGLERLLDA